MKAPRLNRQLTLEAPQRADDGQGGFDITWQPLGTLWAEVTARVGRETRMEEAPVSLANYRIVVRGAPVGDPARPVPGQRFRQDARVFHVHAVVETDADARFLTCFSSEEIVK
jgi:head-tail adaptor